MFENNLQHPNPLTLAPPDQIGGRSTSPLRGEVMRAACALIGPKVIPL